MAMLKGSEPIKEVDDTRELVRDFERRTPYWSYRAASYQDYEPLVHFQPVLDSYLEKLFQGEIDDGNADVLDVLIFDMVRMAIEDLKYQRVSHVDMNNSFVIRMNGDIDAFRQEQQKLSDDLKDVNSEYEKLMDLFRKSIYKEDK